MSFCHINLRAFYLQVVQLEASYCAPDALSFEHFLPWIWKLVLVYQDQDSVTDDQMLPQGASFSQSKRFYKNRRVN